MNKNFELQEIDELFEEFISSYTNGDYADGPVDIVGLVCKYFGLTVYYVRFADDEDIPLGYICNGLTAVNIVHDNKPVKYVFPKNTILLDERLKKKSEADRRHALSHECAHYVYSLFNGHVGEIALMKEGQTMQINDLMELIRKREMLADHGAAAFLLPKALLLNTYHKFVGYDKMRIYGESVFLLEDRVKLAQMAEFLKVPLDMLIERMICFDMFEKRKIGEYVNIVFGSLPVCSGDAV